jgi:hypothetical protein
MCKYRFMKKLLLSALLLCLLISVVSAQEKEDTEEKKGFKLDNLFTGGSISLGFSNYSFTAGASPVFGYNVTKWLDAGLVVNYTYLSYRDLDYYGYGSNDKIRQTVYGGGGFVKIYPISFLFAQAQFEHNFNTQKIIPSSGASSAKYTFQTNSMLVGAGYAGRTPGLKQTFFYLSLLFDVSGVPYTPYTNQFGNAQPIFRGGLQIPLFQGKSRNNYEEEPQRGGGGKRPRNYNRY